MGDIAPSQVVKTIEDGFAIAEEAGAEISLLSLADSMGWGAPHRIEKVVGAVRERWPDKNISLHLHDTRGMGLPNCYAALEMGVSEFDASLGGLGGCPFAAHRGASGNVCTEDLVLMCQEMGIETGVDLEKIIECGRLAEEIVGHPLPGKVLKGGPLTHGCGNAH